MDLNQSFYMQVDESSGVTGLSVLLASIQVKLERKL
jgi:hypothetical protein